MSAMEPARIVHALAPAPFGGLERVVQALAGGQSRRGHRVVVLAAAESVADVDRFAEPLRAQSVEVRPVVVPRRRYLRERAMIGAELRRIGPDIVHTHGYHMDVLAPSEARRVGAATVSTVHGFTGGDSKNRAYEWLQLRSFSRFDAVVAVSADLARQLASHRGVRLRLRTVQNAWCGGDVLPARTARERLGLSGNGAHIGWIGRLSAEKGPDLVLDAMRQLPDMDLTLSMVGTGPDQERLEEFARRYGIADRVRWHGFVPDAGRYLRAFQAVVLSSRTEGTPIVLFEAMAAGVPVVSFRVGGIPDVVNSELAVLVEPLSTTGLAAGIRDVLLDLTGSARRATRASERLASFTQEAWLEHYDCIYRSIARKREP